MADEKCGFRLSPDHDLQQRLARRWLAEDGTVMSRFNTRVTADRPDEIADFVREQNRLVVSTPGLIGD